MFYHLRRSHLLAVGLVLLVVSCSTDTGSLQMPRVGQGPVLAVIDSIRLTEPDSAFLSFPTAVEPLQSGGLLIGDATSSRIFVYAPDGTLVRLIGRRGQGPGEFVVPGAMAVLGDTVLAVADWQIERLTLLDLRTGEPSHSFQIGGLAYSLAWRGDTLMGGMYGRTKSTSNMEILPASDSVRLGGTTPPAYRASAGVRSVHPYFSIAVLPDRMLTGFTGSNDLHEVNAAHELTVFRIPVEARRPMPDDIVRRFEAPLTDSMIAGMGSTLVGLFPMDDHRVAAVNLDVLLNGQLITASGWLSVVDLQTRMACPDAPIGSTDAGKPIFTVVGDTLVIVEQRLGPSGAGESWVRRLQILVDHCHWIPLEIIPTDP